MCIPIITTTGPWSCQAPSQEGASACVHRNGHCGATPVPNIRAGIRLLLAQLPEGQPSEKREGDKKGALLCSPSKGQCCPEHTEASSAP